MHLRTLRENLREKEVVKMKFMPYKHQQAGIDWVIRRPACALFWGMG